MDIFGLVSNRSWVWMSYEPPSRTMHRIKPLLRSQESDVGGGPGLVGGRRDSWGGREYGYNWAHGRFAAQAAVVAGVQKIRNGRRWGCGCGGAFVVTIQPRTSDGGPLLTPYEYDVANSSAKRPVTPLTHAPCWCVMVAAAPGDQIWPCEYHRTAWHPSHGFQNPGSSYNLSTPAFTQIIQC